jgi:hypothetical protein
MITYKNKTAADELAILMQKEISSNTAEENTNTVKISEAINYLNQAADIFESLQDKQASEVITSILEKMAGVNV